MFRSIRSPESLAEFGALPVVMDQLHILDNVAPPSVIDQRTGTANDDRRTDRIADSYKAAIASKWPRFSTLQRQILESLFAAGTSGATASQLARLLGRRDKVEINGAFGRLAHGVYDELNDHPEGLREGDFQWWHVVATGTQSAHGWRWSLRPEVVAALEELELKIPVQPLSEEVEEYRSLFEGCVRQVCVNAYERNPIARQRCLAAHGYACTICHFDFGATYGTVAANYIHVHHLVPLAQIAEEYEVDPVHELVPVCPNCHAVVHRRSPPYSIQEVREMLFGNCGDRVNHE